MSNASEGRIWEADGSISRRPKAVAALLAQVHAALGAKLDGLQVAPQQWGRGGALHFAAAWRTTGTPVLVKVGLGENELHWTTQLARACPDLVPTLFAAGDRLGDLTVGWAVLEGIPYGPLGPLWQGEEFAMTLQAGVRFQHEARDLPRGDTPIIDATTVRNWVACGLQAGAPGPGEAVAARVEEDYAWVASTCGRDVCHHDLHLGNVVTRVPPPRPSLGLLVDLAAVLQPWPFDAAYLQVLNSTDAARPGTQGLIPKMAGFRRQCGLPVPTAGDLPRVSALALAWFAMRQWAQNPERHALPDYRAATERYIEEGAAA